MATKPPSGAHPKTDPSSGHQGTHSGPCRYRTYKCTWCGGTTGNLPTGTPQAERICDPCVTAQINRF